MFPLGRPSCPLSYSRSSALISFDGLGRATTSPTLRAVDRQCGHCLRREVEGREETSSELENRFVGYDSFHDQGRAFSAAHDEEDEDMSRERGGAVRHLQHVLIGQTEAESQQRDVHERKRDLLDDADDDELGRFYLCTRPSSVRWRGRSVAAARAWRWRHAQRGSGCDRGTREATLYHASAAAGRNKGFATITVHVSRNLWKKTTLTTKVSSARRAWATTGQAD